MRDGRQSECRACDVERSREYRRANAQTVRAKDRERYSDRYDTDKQRARVYAWRERNPEHYAALNKAHLAIKYNVERGHITRPERCEWCGSDGPLEAHHEDHTRKLDVVWLCRDCHGLTKRSI